MNTKILLFFWLIGWFTGLIYTSYSVLWQLFGYEIITIIRGKLNLKESVIGFGLKKEYAIELIRNLDINSKEESGTICFDYANKSIKMAREIEEAEARILIALLRKNRDMKEENFAF